MEIKFTNHQPCSLVVVNLPRNPQELIDYNLITLTQSCINISDILEPPQLIIRPIQSPLRVSVGGHLPIHCIAEKGVPVPVVQWHSDGFPVQPTQSFYQQIYLYLLIFPIQLHTHVQGQFLVLEMKLKCPVLMLQSLLKVSTTGYFQQLITMLIFQSLVDAYKHEGVVKLLSLKMGSQHSFHVILVLP